MPETRKTYQKKTYMKLRQFCGKMGQNHGTVLGIWRAFLHSVKGMVLALWKTRLHSIMDTIPALQKACLHSIMVLGIVAQSM